MLPENYRFILYNDCGQQLDFSGNSANEKASVTIDKRYIDPSDGLINSESADTTGSASTDLADGGTEVLLTKTGEERTYLEGYFHVETDNTSADGNVILGIEFQKPGTSTWPSDATNWDPDEDLIPIAVITLGGSESHSQSFHWE